MDKKSLSQSVLGRIKEEHIAPRPAWHFALKNALFWLVFAASAVMGARAMGVVIFVLSDLRPELMFKGGVPPVVQVVPLIWLLFFVLTILIAVLGLHHTKKGYKLSIGLIILINILATLLLGGVFFALGDGKNFEETVSEHLPFVPAPELRRQRVWNTPVEGRLAGEIQENSITTTATSTTVTLIDLNGASWQVDLNGLPLPPANPETGEGQLLRVRILGVQTGEHTFKASAIYPWRDLPPPPQHREIPREQNGERMNVDSQSGTVQPRNGEMPPGMPPPGNQLPPQQGLPQPGTSPQIDQQPLGPQSGMPPPGPGQPMPPQGQQPLPQGQNPPPPRR